MAQSFSSPREVFEHVKQHLLSQGERAWSEGLGGCVYRTNDGRSCAVGCLIDDSAYVPDMEEAAMTHVLVNEGQWQADEDSYDSDRANALAGALSQSGIPATKEMRVLLRRLQDIHDSCDPDRWAHHLDRLEQELFPS